MVSLHAIMDGRYRRPSFFFPSKAFFAGLALLVLPEIVSRSVCCVQGLAAELAPNVRVNCVAPGIVPTHFASALVANEASVSILETMLSRCLS